MVWLSGESAPAYADRRHRHCPAPFGAEFCSAFVQPIAILWPLTAGFIVRRILRGFARKVTLGVGCFVRHESHRLGYGRRATQ